MALTKATYGMISADTSSIDLSIDANTLYVDSSANRVGIGTSSPGAPLSIITNNASQPSNYATVWAKNTDTTGAAFAGYVADGHLQSHYRYYIQGALKWQTRVGNGAGTDTFAIYSWTKGADVLNILNTGNVGIGTTSPGDTLEVFTSAANKGITIKSGTGSGFENPTLTFVDVGNSSSTLAIKSDNFCFSTYNVTDTLKITGSNGALTSSPAAGGHQVFNEGGNDADFRVESTASNGNEEFALYIDGASGRVGISEGSPDQQLHVTSGASNVVAKFESTDSVAVLQLVDNGGNAEIGCVGNDVVLFPAGTEKFRVQSSTGYLVAQSAAQVRLVLGSSGNSSNNTSNWIRGDGTALGLNSGGGSIGFEINGSAKATINATGQILLNSLGVSTPTFAFINDTNTGMSRPTTDALNFVTAGVERLRVTSTGNLEFKSTTSTFTGASSFTNHSNGYLYLRGGTSGLRLDDDSSINTIQIGDGSSGYIKFETGNGTERMRINNVGNVGIGIAGPTEKLHIGAAGKLKISRADNARSMFLYTNNADCVIQSDVDPLHLQSANRMTFATNGASERMRIATDGKIGIGTPAPIATLQVGLTSDSAATAGSLVHLASSTASATVNGFSHLKLDCTTGHSPGDIGAQIMFNQGYHGGNQDYTQAVGAIRGRKTGNSNNYGGGLQFMYQPDQGALGILPGMTMTGLGKVGIGVVDGEANLIVRDATDGTHKGGRIGFGIHESGALQMYHATNMSRTAGNIVTDSTSSGGDNVTLSSGQLYGPYHTLPRGQYRMCVKMKTTNAGYAGYAARITLHTSSGKVIPGTRQIRGTDFEANNKWQTFSVPFQVVATGSAFAEFYMFPENSQAISVDYFFIMNDIDSHSTRVYGNQIVDGDVGIAHDNPLSELHVKGNIAQGAIGDKSVSSGVCDSGMNLITGVHNSYGRGSGRIRVMGTENNQNGGYAEYMYSYASSGSGNYTINLKFINEAFVLNDYSRPRLYLYNSSSYNNTSSNRQNTNQTASSTNSNIGQIGITNVANQYGTFQIVAEPMHWTP